MSDIAVHFEIKDGAAEVPCFLYLYLEVPGEPKQGFGFSHLVHRIHAFHLLDTASREEFHPLARGFEYRGHDIKGLFALDVVTRLKSVKEEGVRVVLRRTDGINVDVKAFLFFNHSPADDSNGDEADCADEETRPDEAGSAAPSRKRRAAD